MKKLTGTFCILFALFISFFLINSCSKKDDTTYLQGGSSGSAARTTVSGIVLDESNSPLNGVSVSGYGQTTTTNQDGIFVLKNLNANKGRCIIQISKTGFFNRVHGFIPSANTVNYVRIVLVSSTTTQSFSASTGGTINLPDNSSVQFQPNSFATATGSSYTGTVNIAIKHLSPDDVTFGFSIPGGDLAGKDAAGKDVVLYSYGMLGVVLTGSSGEPLQLVSGTTATLTMSVAASQVSSAPSTIPLWYFDETSFLWKEEGQATLVGNNYVGTVGHFSWWNCDYGGPKSYVTGKVVDCDGNPVSNLVVTIDNDYNSITDQNGVYNTWIPSGYSFTIQVLVLYNQGVISQNSQVEIIPALATNQVYTVPDLIIPCISRLAGVLHNCSGEITDGLVTASFNNYSSFGYTTSGYFSFPVGSNLLLNVNAQSSTNYFHLDTTSTSPGSVLDLHNILLCDTINHFPNSIFISNCTLQNDTIINFVPILNSLGIASGQYSYLSIQSIGHSFETYIGGITTGNYGWSTINTTSSISVGFPDSTFLDTYPINTVSGTINVNIGGVGELIIGNYLGTAILYKNGSSAIANINGNFQIVRTQ